MSRSTLVLFAFISLMLLTFDLSAANNSTAFGGSEIRAQADKIQDFLFGPMMRFVAVLGCVWGFFASMIGGSIRPLLTFGGIGLGTALGPKFIEGVFGLLIQ